MENSTLLKDAILYKMKYIEFHDLEQQASESPEKLLEILRENLRTKGLKFAVETLKLSGICVDIYGDQRYKALLNDAVKVIQDHTLPKQQGPLRKLLRESECFEGLFRDFESYRAGSGVTAIPKEQQIAALLLAGEIFLSSLYEFSSTKKTIEEINDRYPFTVALINNNGEIADPKKAFIEAIHILDNVMEWLGTILKYLYYIGMPSIGLKDEISRENLSITRRHVELFDSFISLLRTYEDWRFWGGNLDNRGRFFYYSHRDENNFYAYRISVFRNRIFRNSHIQKIKLLRDQINVLPDTNVLPPEGFRSIEELITADFCYNYFGSLDLSESVLGITLAEWVRSYIILQEESFRFLESRDYKSPMNLSNWCINKTKQGWVQLLVDNGIESSKAKDVVNNLTFNAGSRDLIDCPLIPIEDDFLVALPTLVTFLSPADAMLSNFIQRTFEISFRGTRFENQVIKMLDEAKIPAKNIKTTYEGQEYECDIAFILDDTLFLTECKTFLQPQSPRDYYAFIGKIANAVTQLTRISIFFQNHLDIVKRELNLDESWQPKSIYNLIITNAFLGRPYIIEDCHITDMSLLTRFFSRQSPGIQIGHVAIPKPNKDYNGEINKQKLMHAISNSLPIRLTRERLKRRRDEIRFATKVLIKVSLVGNEMSYLDEVQFEKLADALKVPKNSFEKMVSGIYNP
jgi:hypothetical protein